MRLRIFSPMRLPRAFLGRVSAYRACRRYAAHSLSWFLNPSSFYDRQYRSYDKWNL